MTASPFFIVGVIDSDPIAINLYLNSPDTNATKKISTKIIGSFIYSLVLEIVLFDFVFSYFSRRLSINNSINIGSEILTTDSIYVVNAGVIGRKNVSTS